MKTSKFSIKEIQIHVQNLYHHGIIHVNHNSTFSHHPTSKESIMHISPQANDDKAYYKTCEDLKDLYIENSHTFQVFIYR